MMKLRNFQSIKLTHTLSGPISSIFFVSRHENFYAFHHIWIQTSHEPTTQWINSAADFEVCQQFKRAILNRWSTSIANETYSYNLVKNRMMRNGYPLNFINQLFSSFRKPKTFCLCQSQRQLLFCAFLSSTRQSKESLSISCIEPTCRKKLNSGLTFGQSSERKVKNQMQEFLKHLPLKLRHLNIYKSVLMNIRRRL